MCCQQLVYSQTDFPTTAPCDVQYYSLRSFEAPNSQTMVDVQTGRTIHTWLCKLRLGRQPSPDIRLAVVREGYPRP